MNETVRDKCLRGGEDGDDHEFIWKKTLSISREMERGRGVRVNRTGVVSISGPPRMETRELYPVMEGDDETATVPKVTFNTLYKPRASTGTPCI